MTRALGVIGLVAALWVRDGAAQALDTDAVSLAMAAVPALADESVTSTVRVTPDRYEPSNRGGRRFAPAVERWRQLVAGYDWDVDTALAVITCESRGDPGAVNRFSGASGLFQLLGWSGLARRLFGSGDVFDPGVNAGTAAWLWRDSGGSFRWHWAASVGCWG